MPETKETILAENLPGGGDNLIAAPALPPKSLVPPPSPAMIPNPSWPLGDLMRLMEDFDAAVVALTDDQIAGLVEAIPAKVENYHGFVDFVRLRGKQFREHASQFEKTARGLEGRADAIESRLAYLMSTAGVKKLAGERWQATVKTNERIELKNSSCSAEDFLAFPAFAKSEFSWSKTEIKNALKAGDLEAAKVADLKTSMTIQWKPT